MQRDSRHITTSLFHTGHAALAVGISRLYFILLRKTSAVDVGVFSSVCPGVIPGIMETIKKHNAMKKLFTLLFACCMTVIPSFGQQVSTDVTEYRFRFVADNDMFYVPWGGNGEELERLTACIEENREAIMSGEIPVEVEGRCDTQQTREANIAMAKTRANRVKSEIITRTGITEDCFRTRSRTSGGNVVTVWIAVPVGPSEAEVEAARQAEAERLAAEKRAEEERLAAEKRAEEERLAREAAEKQAEAERLAAEKQEAAEQQAETQTAATQSAEPAKRCSQSLALRANLLRWATLTPDIGIEWRIGRTWAVTVNGSWTSWSWDSANRRYAMWEVAPEVRWYLGAAKRGYIGAMFKTGAFNYKLSATGKQGDLMGGGITGGYQLRLTDALSLDFSLGLGYLNADYEKYEVIDGVRVRRGNETKGWWGPVNAGITLTWNLF